MLSFLSQLFLPGQARCRRLVLYWQNLLPRRTRRCHWCPKIEHQALKKRRPNHVAQRNASPVQSEQHVLLLANHRPPTPLALHTCSFVLLTRRGLLHPLALGDYESTSRRLRSYVYPVARCTRATCLFYIPFSLLSEVFSFTKSSSIEAFQLLSVRC